MLETVGLLLLVDPSLELSVNGSCFFSFLIVKLILDHSAQMMKEPNCTKSCRPMPVGPDAVQKLLGVGISMLRGRGQVGNGFCIIPLDLFAIEIDFPELVLCIVISILGGYLEVSDRPKDIFYLGFGEANLSGEICGVGILLSGGSLQIINRAGNVLLNDLAMV